MNNICLISENNLNYITLNFKNNTFNIDTNIYIFDIIEHDKILIYQCNEKFKKISDNIIYYTEDSFLYFMNKDLMSKYKKIFLINNEWNDQALIDIENLYIKRIKNNDQYGNIEFIDDKLIINWNYWGKEIYIKIDNYSYIQENYKNHILEYNKNIPIHIFIHITMIEMWENIFIEFINTIKKSGLYDVLTKIHLGILGNISNIKSPFFNEYILNDPKINIIYIDQRNYLYEIHTINSIKSFCENHNDEEIYILYIHTKGVRKAGNENVTTSWRNMMSYFLIENYYECIKGLKYFDTIGNNIVNMYCNNNDINFVNNYHTLHYSGNFWWSKKSYILKLNYLKLIMNSKSINTRFQAENWILSGFPNCNIGIIFQDDTNTHPYHRYVFDYYKKLKIIIKNYKN
jgi:hypothetical protein